MRVAIYIVNHCIFPGTDLGISKEAGGGGGDVGAHYDRNVGIAFSTRLFTLKKHYTWQTKWGPVPVHPNEF